jgi:chromate reductase, NAD(P)H dehydrogenase (quinone)
LYILQQIILYSYCIIYYHITDIPFYRKQITKSNIIGEYKLENKLKILGFAGSLRAGSYNKALLRAAIELLPEGATLEIFDLLGIPAYNQDLESDMPTKIKEFKSKIREESDAILIATPEYNYSVPGVLKNAIDWASRPYGDNSFDGKPVAIMSASIGMLGGARAQYHLRQMFVFLNMYPVNAPEVIVTFAQEKFDANGKLVDENTRKFLAQLLQNLANWTRRLRGEKPSM